MKPPQDHWIQFYKFTTVFICVMMAIVSILLYKGLTG